MLFRSNAKRCVQTCWGQRTAQRLQAHGMDAKNTPVTGAVMMDFLRPEFKGYVEKPSDVLSVGQVISAKVVDFNEDDRKISLSMKALENADDAAEEN